MSDIYLESALSPHFGELPKDSKARKVDGDFSVGEIQRDGSGTPLFVLAEGRDWEQVALSILGDIEADTPIYRLAVADTISLRTLHGMALGMLQVMLKLKSPDRPLRIVGIGCYSIVAYELGIQCIALDEELEFLGVFDNGEGALSSAAGLAWVPEPSVAQLASAFRAYEVEPSTVKFHWFTSDENEHRQQTNNWAKALRPQLLRRWICSALDGADAFASFGTLLVQALEEAHVTKQEVRAEDRYIPILTIQSGLPKTVPYFCIPGAGANITDFIPFASAIGESSPIYGLQSRGMSGGFVPHGSVEAAACIYLRELEKVYPRGPVHVVGHSFGGWIAFELAVRLRQRGKEVLSLTLLDSEAPEVSTKIGFEYTRPEALMALVSLYELAIERTLGLRREDFDGISSTQQLLLLQRQLVRVGVLSKRSVPEQLRGTMLSVEACLRTRYQPSKTFDGLMHLVLVSEGKKSAEDATKYLHQVTEAWRRHAPYVQSRLEQGNHVTLLKTPHIASIVRWLRCE